MLTWYTLCLMSPTDLPDTYARALGNFELFAPPDTIKVSGPSSVSCVKRTFNFPIGRTSWRVCSLRSNRPSGSYKTQRVTDERVIEGKRRDKKKFQILIPNHRYNLRERHIKGVCVIVCVTHWKPSHTWTTIAIDT